MKNQMKILVNWDKKTVVSTFSGYGEKLFENLLKRGFEHKLTIRGMDLSGANAQAVLKFIEQAEYADSAA